MRAPGGFFPTPEPVPTGSWKPAILAAAAVAALMIVLYWPAVDFKLLAFDDQFYTRSPNVSGGLTMANLVRIFTQIPLEDNYLPVTQLSYIVDIELFGYSSRGFHLTNMLVHAANMALLVLLLWRLTGSLGKSVFASLLVGLHPLRVESVAWISQRKDILCIFFLLLTLCCYVGYARSGRWRWYAASVVSAVLCMFSKPVGVVLPFLMLAIDFWPLGRFVDREAAPATVTVRGVGRLALEKVPFLVVSAFMSWVTVFIQQDVALRPGISIGSRLEHSFVSYFIYLWQTIWPSNLIFRIFEISWAQYSGMFLPAAAGLLLVSWAAFRQIPARPYLAACWLWYLVSLFPNSGIVPAGVYWIADRYTYLPHIGVAVAVVWAAGDIGSKSARRALLCAGVLVLPLLGYLTRNQLGYWKDGASYFAKAYAYNASDLRYIYFYVRELLEVGEYEKARVELDRVSASELGSAFGPQLQLSRLFLLENTVGREAAVAKAREYLAADPGSWNTRMRLADLLLEGRRFGEAVEHYRIVLASGPREPRVRLHAMESLGNALLGAGKDDEALAAYSDLVNAGGNSPSAQRAMGRIMARRRNIAEAVAHYTAALDLSGGSPAIRIELADLLLESGDVAGAGANYREAWLSAEGSAESLYAEGRMREVAGERDQAMLLYQRALKARALAPETLDTVQRRLGGGKQD